MKELTSTENISSLIRAQVIKQTRLDPEYVRAATLEFGADFDKEVDGLFESFNTSEAFIFFESEDRESESNVSMTMKDGSIIYYKSYEYTLHIYGEPSTDLANELIARFRTEKVRNDLLDNGVYLEKIDDAIETREFINGLIWLRHDVNIDISCKLRIEQLDDYQDFYDINSVSIDKTT